MLLTRAVNSPCWKTLFMPLGVSVMWGLHLYFTDLSALGDMPVLRRPHSLFQGVLPGTHFRLGNFLKKFYKPTWCGIEHTTLSWCLAIDGCAYQLCYWDSQSLCSERSKFLIFVLKCGFVSSLLWNMAQYTLLTRSTVSIVCQNNGEVKRPHL